MRFDLCDIFERCLKANYKTVENDGSYSTYKTYDTRYILFQQSNGIVDWKNNFDFPAKPYSGMDVPWKCHRGFLRVWKSIRPFICNALIDSNFKNCVIVGYSHGAAIAALCFEYVWYNFPEKRKCLYGFSFGSPKIFYGRKNFSFLENRFENYINIINANDLVTKLPPKIFGYRRLGKEINIGKGKKFFSVNDHRAENYQKGLKSINCTIDI